MGIEEIIKDPHKIIIGAITVGVTFTAIYFTNFLYNGYKLERKLRVERKKWMEENMGDPSELIKNIERVRFRPTMDNPPVSYEKNTVASYLLDTPIIREVRQMSEVIYLVLKNMISNKPNFVTIYVNEFKDGERKVKVELTYDNGIKSKEFKMRSATKDSFYKAIEFLRTRGYAIGVVS